ncbi:MAG TPA: hypothetical protein VFO46_10680 [Candidatus Sulfotelmatobacter sp.]|nr:hypothetical protein [Candidatus Sulfotelmatobacter sp.]
MLSKCANPECSNQFRYLHQGKIFVLTPIPELEEAGLCVLQSFHERFWLCDRCCKDMKIGWDGIGPKLIRLPAQPADQRPLQAVTMDE